MRAKPSNCELEVIKACTADATHDIIGIDCFIG